MAKTARVKKVTKFSVEVFDQEIRERLTDPGMLSGPLQEMFEEAATLGKRVATDAVDGGRGIAVRSIGSRIKPLEMRVYSAMPRARANSIEKGRKAGQKPPLGQIIRWKEAMGIREAGIVIAREIERKGVAGKRFMEQAKLAVNAALPRLFSEMGKKMQRSFGK